MKTQISLHIQTVSSESSLFAQWIAKKMFLRADREDSSDWAYAKAGLSLHCAHKSFCWFYHAVAHVCGKLFTVCAKNSVLLVNQREG